jgi:beta-glucuronidase
LIQNAFGRKQRSLNGEWRTIVDPYDAGTYEAFFLNRKPKDQTERIEFDFDSSPRLTVPGDWSSQRAELFLYEGSVWYKTDFDAEPQSGRRQFVHFGAANYEANVYLNGKHLGQHVGGFTPFNFELTEALEPGNNFLIVKVNNRREREAVPTLSTDWWNYGGLTRDVSLIDVPETFIVDYSLALAKGSPKRIAGFVQLDGPERVQKLTLRIAEAAFSLELRTDAAGFARFEAEIELEQWSPERPKLYEVELESETERVVDRVGFRALEVRGQEILLNGAPLFLRGISLHEQAPAREGRAVSVEDARILLGWARELGCNCVRLAHYPHNEHIVRLADELGILLWAEVPVYWAIEWENPATLANAKNQLRELITRDKNRASVILWSVGNETPPGAARLAFMTELVRTARELDSSRPITAALFKGEVEPNHHLIDDPLGEQLDVLGCNEYLGWYEGLPEKCDRASWESRYDKPLIMSEFGGDALHGMHGSPLTRWSEEYQAEVYERQLAMLERIPFLRGLTPWILTDFRSPRRVLPGIQEYWNRKGLISSQGQKKKAFFVLQAWYRRLAELGR